MTSSDPDLWVSLAAAPDAVEFIDSMIRRGASAQDIGIATIIAANCIQEAEGLEFSQRHLKDLCGCGWPRIKKVLADLSGGPFSIKEGHQRAGGSRIFHCGKLTNDPDPKGKSEIKTQPGFFPVPKVSHDRTQDHEFNGDLQIKTQPGFFPDKNPARFFSAEEIDSKEVSIQLEDTNRNASGGKSSLSRPEALAVASWFLKQWESGIGGTSHLLPIFQDQKRGINLTEERRVSSLIEPSMAFIQEFVGRINSRIQPELREAIAKRKLTDLMERIHGSPLYCGDNKERKQLSLEQLIKGNRFGLSGIAKDAIIRTEKGE